MHYLALLYGREDSPATAPGTPEFEAEIARYAAAEAAAGSAIAGGVALYPSAEAVSISQGIVTDGPFAEQAEVVGGFTVFETEDFDSALELARQLPAAEDGFVELWPMVEFTEAAGPMSDWWVALLLEPPGDTIEPGTPDWEKGIAEHSRFGEQFGPSIRGGGALHPATSATTLRVRDGQLLMTDGPFAESAEVANGFYYLAAPDRAVATEVASHIPLGPKGRTVLRQVVDLSE